MYEYFQMRRLLQIHVALFPIQFLIAFMQKCSTACKNRSRSFHNIFHIVKKTGQWKYLGMRLDDYIIKFCVHISLFLCVCLILCSVEHIFPSCYQYQTLPQRQKRHPLVYFCTLVNAIPQYNYRMGCR